MTAEQAAALRRRPLAAALAAAFAEPLRRARLRDACCALARGTLAGAQMRSISPCATPPGDAVAGGAGQASARRPLQGAASRRHGASRAVESETIDGVAMLRLPRAAWRHRRGSPSRILGHRSHWRARQAITDLVPQTRHKDSCSKGLTDKKTAVFQKSVFGVTLAGCRSRRRSPDELVRRRATRSAPSHRRHRQPDGGATATASATTA